MVQADGALGKSLLALFRHDGYTEKWEPTRRGERMVSAQVREGGMRCSQTRFGESEGQLVGVRVLETSAAAAQNDTEITTSSTKEPSGNRHYRMLS